MEILGYITGNPTYTTSHWATETSAGLCPPLSASVGEWGSVSTTAVVSEYATRLALDEIELENGVSGYNLGGHDLTAGIIGIFESFEENNPYYAGADTGDYCIRDPEYWKNNWRDLTTFALSSDDIKPHTIKYRSFDVHPAHKARIKLSYAPGLSGIGSALQFFYDGRPSEDVLIDSKGGETAQGGRYQMMSRVPGDGWPSVRTVPAENITVEYEAGIEGEFSVYTVSGYCDKEFALPIQAHNKSCLGWRDADMAIAKIGIRIPYGNGFPVSDQKISLGIKGEPGRFGYFYTKTNLDVYSEGEWQTFYYAGSLSANQYDYFTEPSKIYAYAHGVTLAKGPGNQKLDPYATDIEVGNWFGEFDMRVFFDKVEFNTIRGPIYGYGIGSRYEGYTTPEKIKEERRDLESESNPVPTDVLSFSTDTYQNYPSCVDAGSVEGYFGGGCVENHYFCQVGINADGGVKGFNTTWANETWEANDIFTSEMPENPACDQNDTQGVEPVYGIFGAQGTALKYTFADKTNSEFASVDFPGGFESNTGVGNDRVSYFINEDSVLKLNWSVDVVEDAASSSKAVYGPNTDYSDRDSDLVLDGFVEPSLLGTICWTDAKDYGYILGADTPDQQIMQYSFATEVVDFIWGTPPVSNWFGARENCRGTYSWTKGYMMSASSNNNKNEQNYTKFDYSSGTAEEIVNQLVPTRASQCTTQSR